MDFATAFPHPQPSHRERANPRHLCSIRFNKTKITKLKTEKIDVDQIHSLLSSNLVVAGFAERAGQPIRFLPFMLLAFPLMLMSIAVSTIYLWWRYL